MKGEIVDILYKNPEISQTILNRIQFNEKLRKELQSGSKGEESMLFLTEGDSASASIVSSRDLRGKPLNVFGLKLDQLYKNEEMFHVMSALNIQHGIDDLRYHKVIIATDADVDFKGPLI
ncbi:hypothetical protein ACTFIW_003732 [Dictyostelium discoideum]